MPTFIPTRLHAVLDYIVSVFVAALPFLFGEASGLRWAFVALGAFGIAYSLLTDYELGAVKLLPLRTHLFLDVVFIVGLLLLALNVAGKGLAGTGLVVAIAAGLLVAFTRRPPGISPGVRRASGRSS